jgi:predicted alpha/beta-fold hydrolase
LELNVKEGQKNNPVVVLIHGLEGSAESRYITELTNSLSSRDYSVVAVNLRGCGPHMNKKRRFYHAGETGDLNSVLSWIHEHLSYSYLGAVGFSLGGTVLLKLLGEMGASTLIHSAAIERAVCVSVPYDLYWGSQRIQKGAARIYERMFVKSMNHKLEEKRNVYRDLPVFTGSSLYEFDDQVTAPVHGFNNAADYYMRCSSSQFLDDIKTSLLLIHSKDDPLCPFTMVPMKKIKDNNSIDYIITNGGGHVGFWSRPYGWLNRTIMNYFSKNFD